MKKNIYTIISCICGIIVIILGIYLGHHIYSDARSASEYDEYRSKITSAPINTNNPKTENLGKNKKSNKDEKNSGQDVPAVQDGQETEETTQKWPDPPVIDWGSMDGITAWIEVPAVSISYPVVQGSDNGYYLHRAPNGEYRYAGSIFLDSENAADFTDLHTIIYGHNMKNGSMFGSLKQLNAQSTLDTYPYIWICTRTKNLLYKIVSVHKAQTGGESYLLFDGTVEHKDFDDWMAGEIQKSDVPTEAAEESKGRLLTLSTCKSGDTRQVVQGQLVCEMIPKE